MFLPIELSFYMYQILLMVSPLSVILITRNIYFCLSKYVFIITNFKLARKLGILNNFSMLHTLFTDTVYKVYMLYLAEEKIITKLFLITYE